MRNFIVNVTALALRISVDRAVLGAYRRLERKVLVALLRRGRKVQGS